MEIGGGACRTEFAGPPTTRCRCSSERMIPADRITDGIVYKTHFANWEKPVEPVSSRKADATHVKARIASPRLYPFLHPSFCRLRHSGKVCQSNRPDRFSFLDSISFAWQLNFSIQQRCLSLSWYFQLDDSLDAHVYFIKIYDTIYKRYKIKIIIVLKIKFIKYINNLTA